MITQPDPTAIADPIPPSPSKAAELVSWLDDRESELAHPSEVESQLTHAGWYPNHAAAAATQYRRRFNEHALGYSVLMATTGVAALAAGTAGHLVTVGLDQPINRNALAGWLSALVCTVPFAVWSHRWAARVDRDDPVAAWSRSRRTMALLLAWACGVVGVVRLFVYAAQLIGVMLGATWAHSVSLAAGAINVAITVGIALPLGLWAFRFLHRFDSEDPAVPAPQRRRGAR
jgi:hypothetical protein